MARTAASTVIIEAQTHMTTGRNLGAMLCLACCLVVCCGCQPAVPTNSTITLQDPPAPTRDELRRELDQVLESVAQRRLSLGEHAAWQILHGVLAYGREFTVESETGGELVAAVDHLLDGGHLQGWSVEPGVVIDEASQRRGLRTLVDAGSKVGQGHHDQWFAILAQCGLKPSAPIRAAGHVFTMSDFVAQVQWDLPRNVDSEFSWTLIGLTSYLPSDARWDAQDGQLWSIERLVEAELQQELPTSPCGGTHRLIGLAMALNQHLAQGGEVTGVWATADQLIQESIAKARQFQNPNGSFSTNYFERPGSSPDLAEDLGATGHVLEFLTLAATDEQLNAPWIERAVVHLCGILRKTHELPLECGALYHAAHALVLYRQRLTK